MTPAAFRRGAVILTRGAVDSVEQLSEYALDRLISFSCRSTVQDIESCQSEAAMRALFLGCFATTVFSIGFPLAAGAVCDPNYQPIVQGAPCVPVDSDVDCAGGKGNGPSYAQGPVRVVGQDIYGLDRDKDGLGCEPPDWGVDD